MPATNTSDAYGSVTKTFHWMTAFLILTAFPLGLVANNMPFDTSEALAQKAFVFSLHKTVGVMAFAVALGRILWALTQTKPAAMHPERRAETFAAETVHWLLYASMLVVPLSGWIHHAATTGFAPILWPFGQGLPLVPQSQGVELFFKEIHFVFTKVLGVAVFLHIAGAVKHAVIDRDGTLARMWGGTDKIAPPRVAHSAMPVLAAAVIYVAGFGGAFALVQSHAPVETESAALEEVASEWQVQEGTLSITVQQLGAAVTGSFADWTAAISFDETADAQGTHGSVGVEIAIGSLTLGSVTNEALGADFFNAADFPTARFDAVIRAAEGGAEGGYVAEGTLSLRDAQVPVALPFALTLDGDQAAMTAEVVLDRRDFGMGETYPDESTVGFSVAVSVALQAIRGE
jgi:cytochrome b561/polyisoprenoid-binding protein YceI